MNGLRRNTEKLFSHGGKLFAMAMDLPQCGLVEGLEDPLALIREVKDTELDALLVNLGVARLAQEELLHKKLLLRTSSGGTNLAAAFSNVQKNHVSPETALAMGADAVVMMMVLGGADYASIQDAAAAIDAYHRLSIPVIVEILADDFTATQTFDIQANGARVAAELGADVVKAFYTENFEQVVRNCPVPIVLAGGPKGSDILDTARMALQAGARGFCFGRNLFQSEEKRERIAALSKLLGR
ncbi:MAG: hypothetical protein J6H18_04390 [Lachnospiraceae bacterium]|nr:hypothetical protein [Lachnospiraceae bacterium]